MRKYFNAIILIVLLSSCKSNSIENDNLIHELKSIKKDFVIILWKNKVSQTGDPVGFITKTSTNNFIAETGVGLASCELLEMKQFNKNETYIKVKAKKCLETKENEDAPPSCIKWENLIIEYKLHGDQINKLKNTNIDELNITGDIISKEISDK